MVANKHLEAKPTDDQIKSFMKVLDQNNSGTIDKDEFKKFLIDTISRQ